MGRLRTAAAFIKFNMPYDNPGSLSVQQAFDVAAYINSRPRPDFAGKSQIAELRGVKLTPVYKASLR